MIPASDNIGVMCHRSFFISSAHQMSSWCASMSISIVRTPSQSITHFIVDLIQSISFFFWGHTFFSFTNTITLSHYLCSPYLSLLVESYSHNTSHWLRKPFFIETHRHRLWWKQEKEVIRLSQQEKLKKTHREKKDRCEPRNMTFELNTHTHTLHRRLVLYIWYDNRRHQFKVSSCLLNQYSSL